MRTTGEFKINSIIVDSYFCRLNVSEDLDKFSVEPKDTCIFIGPSGFISGATAVINAIDKVTTTVFSGDFARNMNYIFTGVCGARVTL